MPDKTLPSDNPQPPARPVPDALGDTRSEPKKGPSPERPDPTRYGDWEKNGRCIDF